MWWVILFAVIILFVGIIRHENQKARERSDRLKQKLSELPDFQVSTRINGINDFYSFIVDEANRKVALITPASKNVINFSDIIAVELIENDNIIQQKSTSRSVGGALIGAVLAGGAGAIVGGLSGNSVQKTKVSSVKVKMLIRNIELTSVTVECFNAQSMLFKKEVETSNGLYELGKKNAVTIKDLISVIIDRVDSENALKHDQKKNTSISDELHKLNELKQKGVLTENEFIIQKNRLLQ